MAAAQIPADLLVQLAVATLVTLGLALVAAPQIAEFLIRFRARRLPQHFAQRYSEEWIAEVRSMSHRIHQLTFALAISVMRPRRLADAEDGLPGLHTAAVLLSVDDVRVYSEFRSRLIAFAIDVLISAFATRALYHSIGERASEPMVEMASLTIWLVFVHTWCVRMFGGSPGKLLMKLRIVTMSGEPLQSRHALLRALPDYCVGLINQIVILVTIPRWCLVILGFGSLAWVIGKVGTYLESHEGRGLHDLVAGTVVIRKIPHIVGSIDTGPARSTSPYR